jgi:hypothetical protein
VIEQQFVFRIKGQLVAAFTTTVSGMVTPAIVSVVVVSLSRQGQG